MARISITVPTPVAQRVVDAFSTTFATDVRYQGMAGQVLVEAVLVDYIKSICTGFEAQDRGERARLAALEQAQRDFGVIIGDTPPGGGVPKP